MSVRLRIEWQDEERPWAEHTEEVEWPAAPRVGDLIVLPGEDARKVTTIFWDLDGSATVRVEFHPR